MKVFPHLNRTKVSRWSMLTLSGSILWFSAWTRPAIATQQEPEPTPDQVTFFETKIRPVLAENCYPCHGADSQSGKLRLDSRSAMIQGGQSGTALVAGDPDSSLIIKSVRQTGQLKMPAGGRLKPEEIKDLEAWVKMGAPWPSSGPKPAEKAPLWSLQPVRMPELPKVRNTKLVRNPIDNFILAKLEAGNQSFAAEADRRTLIRRVTYDLTGLPPTQSEVDAFLNDKSPDAYEKVVDRLLSSPHYGERSARLWLDVARYADTMGYMFEVDRNFHNAYTYRDWVIRAFNEDLPYDQFITQQIAADKMPEVANGDDKRPLAALGFLTVGRRFLNNQNDIADDRIDVTMRGIEGFTVQCARCHDHKFDPIPTQDYYSLYAVFSSSQEQDLPISEKSIRDPWIQYNQRIAELDRLSKNLLATQVIKLRAKSASPTSTVSQEIKDTLQSIKVSDIPEGEKLAKLKKGFEPEELKKLQGYEEEVEKLNKFAPPKPEMAMALVDRPSAGDSYVFKRGNPANKGEPAPRRFLKALSPAGVERPHWQNGSGRLELAQAITSKNNPLTARVFVNRLWLNHFGNGIVRTPSDFGNQGDKPTHPELLDYLAATFMKEGWSIKKIQRLMVTSAAYRQTSEVTKAQFETDPDNRNLGRMNRHRLDLEQMRDTFLMASGQLDLKDVGGKSVDLWARPFTNRRAVYGYIERQNLPSIFRTFDFASPDSTSARRFQTTVPQQALFFMNSPFSIEQAKAVSARPEIMSAKDEGQRVRRLYQILFNRLPDADEEALATAYLREPVSNILSPAGPWSYGYGSYDSTKHRTRAFAPFKTFDDKGYHIGVQFPDPTFGYVVLNAFGGHPGRDLDHAAIRRWTAPANMTIHIKGSLTHRQAQGDGVRGRVVSSREGLLGEWTCHNQVVSTDIGPFQVQKGDTLDFITDAIVTDSFDSFEWSPTVESDSATKWSSRNDFGPPPPDPLDRLTLYVQALMMTNEFMFVD